MWASARHKSSDTGRAGGHLRRNRRVCLPMTKQRGSTPLYRRFGAEVRSRALSQQRRRCRVSAFTQRRSTPKDPPAAALRIGQSRASRGKRCRNLRLARCLVNVHSIIAGEVVGHARRTEGQAIRFRLRARCPIRSPMRRPSMQAARRSSSCRRTCAFFDPQGSAQLVGLGAGILVVSQFSLADAVEVLERHAVETGLSWGCPARCWSSRQSSNGGTSMPER